MQSDRARRKGYQPGEVSASVQDALRAEILELAHVDDPVARVRAVGSFIAGVETELEAATIVRLKAVAELRGQGLTYDEIAHETQLSKARIARLAEQAGVAGRRPSP